MKTKHLFFATALVASFASCTNDDIVEVQQGVANAERPTVEDVRLNFVAEGVDSRLTFGSNGYAWEADDVIGALNMDQPAATPGKTWSSKYEFTSFINTSYPFTYDAEENVWGTPGKMLEGNYFFAFPFSDYEGERYAKYSLINQQQDGIKGAVVAKNYAENQVFVGYTPIKKGTGFDMLTDIEMTSLLGAIQLRIVNDGEKTYHINKVVVRGDGLASEFKLIPTAADANGHIGHAYNVETVESVTTYEFNPANYMGKDYEGDEVSSAVETDIEKGLFAANRMEALRDIAKYEGEEFVQLFINGTEEERAIAPGATAYALVMANPVEFFPYNAETEEYGDTKKDVEGASPARKVKLELDIYTDEGLISGISLLDVVKGSVSAKVNSTKPGYANTIVVKFEDDMVGDARSMNVYTEEDMLQLINWNLGVAKKTPIIATLMEDVTLTKEAFDLLKSNDKLALTIKSATTADVENEVFAENLTLAADVPADVLAYEGLKIESPVLAEGTVNFSKKSGKISSITALEGATLHIAENSAEVPAVVVIEEGAELTMVEDASVSGSVTFTNKGKMTVAKGGNILGTINNKAALTINGKVNTLNNTSVATLGENAEVAGGTNNGTSETPAYIYTAANSKVASNQNSYGRIKYVSTATITPTGTGYVFDELGVVTVAEATYKNKNVNLFILTGGEVTISETLSMANIEVKEGATAAINVAKKNPNVEGDTDKTLTISTNLKVSKNGKLTTNGKITLSGTTTIVKDAEWTNNGEVSVGAAISNNGVVYNHGTMSESTTLTHDPVAGVVYKPASGETAFNDYWKITGMVKYDPNSAITKATTLNDALELWIGGYDSAYENYYDLNPYKVEEFVYTMNQWKQYGDDAHKSVVLALAGKWLTTDAASDTFEEVFIDVYEKPTSEFKTAVDTYLAALKIDDNTTGANVAKKMFINAKGEFNDKAGLSYDNNAYETKTEAYNALRMKLAGKKYDSYTVQQAMTAWALTDEEIETALGKTTVTIEGEEVNGEYLYIWKEESCKLYAVAAVANLDTCEGWGKNFVEAIDVDLTDIDGVKQWLKDVATKAMKNVTSASKAQTIAGTYYPACNEWGYNDTQVGNLFTEVSTAFVVTVVTP